MNTYDKNSGNARNNGPVNGHEEEIFLSGGFDSFSQDFPSLGGMDTPLGTVSSDYENTYYGNTNTGSNFWEQKHYLGFWEQLFNSFRPTKYDRYKGISIMAAKHFVRNLSLLYMGPGFLVSMGIFFGNATIRASLADKNILSPLFVISLVAFWIVATLIYPLTFRIGAFFMRIIGSFLAMIGRKNISSENMYLISIYSLVPWMFLKILLVVFFPVILIAYVSLGYSILIFISLLEVIVPTIYMTIAIPYMES